MNKFIFSLFLVIVVVSSQCYTLTSCGKCNANSTCQWCDHGSYAGCTDQGQYTSCNATGGLNVTTCPPVCSSVPTVANAICTYPATFKVPSNESYSSFYGSCMDALKPNTNNAVNCSDPDPCNDEVKTLSKTCLDAISKVSCISCFKCDDDFSFTTFSNYVICETACDALISACDGQFKNETCNPFNNLKVGGAGRASLCTNNTATCNDLAGITFTGTPIDPNACNTDSTSATTGATTATTGANTTTGATTATTGATTVTTGTNSTTATTGTNSTTKTTATTGTNSSTSTSTSASASESTTGFGFVLIAPIVSMIVALLF